MDKGGFSGPCTDDMATVGRPFYPERSSRDEAESG